MQAAECLTAGGFIGVGSNGSYQDVPPLDENVPRFIDPAYRQCSVLSNIESSVALLSAQDWGYTLPSDTVGLDSFPAQRALRLARPYLA